MPSFYKTSLGKDPRIRAALSVLGFSCSISVTGMNFKIADLESAVQEHEEHGQGRGEEEEGKDTAVNRKTV